MEVSFRCLRWAHFAFCLGLVTVWTGRAETAVSQPAEAITASAAAAIIRSDLDDKHKIRPGDKLSYRVDQDREEAKILPVTDSGEIELPFNFGRFVAANKTCRTLAAEIRTALEKQYYNNATVHIGLDTINNIRGKAYVSGQVSKPGPVTIPTDSPLKLSQALILAGPPTQWAKLSDVRIMRQVNGVPKTIKVKADAILNGGNFADDIALEPDDLVIVPERGVVF